MFLQLWTHNYAVFLLVCPLWTACWAGQPRKVAFVGAAAVMVVVLAFDTPWLLRTMANQAAGVGDWIQSFWMDLPPSAALVRSLEVFVGGVQYPPYLDYLVLAPSLPGVSVSVGVGLLGLAVIRRQDHDARLSWLLLGWVLIPLTTAWAYSLWVAPVYLVGRYDTIVLPVFLILIAGGLDRLFRVSRWMGGAELVIALAVAVVSSWPALGVSIVPDADDVEAARDLTARAAPGDPIVYTGYRGPVVAYYLSRAGHAATLSPFPTELGEHPCWFSEVRILQRPDLLIDEANRLVTNLVASHHTVWLLGSGANLIDNRLYTPLLKRFVVDPARSDDASHLYALTARS